jgi:hypothetical protein
MVSARGVLHNTGVVDPAIDFHPDFPYFRPMNKPAASLPSPLWTAADATPAPGYDAWLAQELAAGTADLDAGKLTALTEIRKEFGLE